MCNKLLKLVFPIVFSILLISCSDSQKSKAENKKEHTGKESKISIAMMQPPITGLSPLSDDAFKLSRWSTAETLVKLNEKSDAMPMLATQ